MFDAFWGSLGKYQGTLGSNLSTQLMGEEFQAKARRFDSSLQQALFADDMPESVYRMLVAEANAGLPTLHRYLRLRKRLLGIDGDMAYYDVYPPMLGAPPRTLYARRVPPRSRSLRWHRWATSTSPCSRGARPPPGPIPIRGRASDRAPM